MKKSIETIVAELKEIMILHPTPKKSYNVTYSLFDNKGGLSERRILVAAFSEISAIMRFNDVMKGQMELPIYKGYTYRFKDVDPATPGTADEKSAGDRYLESEISKL